MNRRETLLALAALGAAGAPLGARAQPTPKVWRIGYLGPSPDDAPHLVNAFREGLRELGYVDGRNLAVEYRWTTDRGAPLDMQTMVARASELVEKKVDVLAVSIDLPILAAKKAAGSIPIVMLNVSDPIALGLMSSLAHPGGTITGLSRISPEMIGKNLQLLLEIVPGAKRIGLLASSTGAATPLIVRNMEQAAKAQGCALQVVEAGTVPEVESAFATFKRGRAEALVVAGDGLFFVQRRQIADLALAQRLPGIFSYTESVEAGGLISYSPNSAENYRRAAGFIDKILRGAKPGDLPVEQPTKFELALNLKTAKALGIVVPQSLFLRADRTFE